ncbi:coenzyme F420-0:L-glutamate ligase [Candidatus Bathyarchaeota archaeon]|nr:coenzyme F420-0:L-glutamate ligase [Candidatus Bathyarchaeota archaeon]
MVKYRVLVVTTEYWKPGDSYLQSIVDGVKGKIADGDFVVISEKAISTALGNIVDESVIKPSLSARFIAKYWMRVVWGYFLGPLCDFRKKLLQALRNFPLKQGSAHKQVALQYSGLLQALMFGSEGGIDGSNLPYSYVCLPLRNANDVAQEIRGLLSSTLQRNVFTMIVDTDKTYSFRNFHFTPRPTPVGSIHSFGGVFAYTMGRMLRLKRRATPIAVAGCKISVEDSLEIAQAANKARGFGAGRTVWDMAERLEVEVDKVSWEMLMTVKHKPIVIVRSKR